MTNNDLDIHELGEAPLWRVHKRAYDVFDVSPPRRFDATRTGRPIVYFATTPEAALGEVLRMFQPSEHLLKLVEPEWRSRSWTSRVIPAQWAFDRVLSAVRLKPASTLLRVDQRATATLGLLPTARPDTQEFRVWIDAIAERLPNVVGFEYLSRSHADWTNVVLYSDRIDVLDVRTSDLESNRELLQSTLGKLSLVLADTPS